MNQCPVEVEDEKFMFRVIRASFNQRRKTLANGLNNAPDIQVSKEDIAKALEELGVGAGIRGETLTLEQFARLSNILKKIYVKTMQKNYWNSTISFRKRFGRFWFCRAGFFLASIAILSKKPFQSFWYSSSIEE